MQRSANYWDAKGRWTVFLLASSSIACLLADFYGLCPMKIFTPFIFLPASALLLVFAAFDRARGNGRLCRAVVVGLLGGLLAAISYDIFRLPFVFARQWGIESIVPTMDLFQVFPRFGAMVLGQPIDQERYSASTQVVGWIYHFSNGATFGVMYLALVGDSTRWHWLWALLFAVALELGMLITPYPRVFHISVTATFIAVTMAAHSIFGICLGLTVCWLQKRLGTCRPAIPAPPNV